MYTNEGIERPTTHDMTIDEGRLNKFIKLCSADQYGQMTLNKEHVLSYLSKTRFSIISMDWQLSYMPFKSNLRNKYFILLNTKNHRYAVIFGKHMPSSFIDSRNAKRLRFVGILPEVAKDMYQLSVFYSYLLGYWFAAGHP